MNANQNLSQRMSRYHQLCDIAGEKMSRCRCEHMVSNDLVIFSFFFFLAAVNQRSGNYHYHWLMRAHYSLHSARLYKSRSRAKLAEAASGEGEPRDGVCEIADEFQI